MCSRRCTQQIVGILDISDPVSKSLINSVFQSTGAILNGNNFRAQKLHTRHVQSLPLSIFFTHVNHTVHTEKRSSRCRCYTVLTSTGLCDQTCLTHALCEKCLS